MFSGLFAHIRSYIHWVSQNASKSSPIKAEVRVYHQLFKSEDPSAHPDGFLADLSPESQQVFPEAMLDIGFEEVRQRAPWPKEAGEANVSNEGRPESIRFQGMRVGYFCVDKDSTSTKLVLNQITGLKDSAGRT
jgi:glutaminyl-tRNA synthetase